MTALAPEQRQPKRPRASGIIAPSPRLFSVEDFHHMGVVGIFKPADRVELLGGEIVNMAPIDPIHAESTDLGQHCLIALLADRYRVRSQQPVGLGPDSEPVPDISVVKAGSYAKRHPGPKEIALIIEMANSSLQEDLGRKMRMYAAAGVPEYWVVDLNERVLHVFTRPKRGCYASQLTLDENETVTASSITRLKVPVSALIP